MGVEEVRLSLCADDRILYQGTKTLLRDYCQLIREFGKVAGCKTNTHHQ